MTLPAYMQSPDRLTFILYSSNQLKCMAFIYDLKFKIIFVISRYANEEGRRKTEVPSSVQHDELGG